MTQRAVSLEGWGVQKFGNFKFGPTRGGLSLHGFQKEVGGVKSPPPRQSPLREIRFSNETGYISPKTKSLIKSLKTTSVSEIKVR